MSPAQKFFAKFVSCDRDEDRAQPDELLAVAVPSSEGWEDIDDVHWFYGFTLWSAAEGSGEREKSLFIRFPGTAGWDASDLTASLLALIELGQEVLMADQIYLCVKRRGCTPGELNNLVHTLMYVGLEADIPPVGASHPDYLVLRYETE